MGDIEIQGGSETWNVAQGYSITKILKILVLLDDYVRIAEFGSLELEQSFSEPPQVVTSRKLEGIKRLHAELMMLIDNSSFVMRKIGQKEMKKLRSRLERIRKVLPACEIKKVDQRTNQYTITINDNHFFNCLEDLKKIKEEINTPLNRANLIFPESEEVDPDELKRKIIFGG